MERTTQMETVRDIREAICCGYGQEEFLFMDGFDDCIAGVIQRYGQPPIVCYAWDKVIESLQKDGMTFEEAEEFFEFNQLGAWVGDRTPCFLFHTEECVEDPDTRGPLTVDGLKAWSAEVSTVYTSRSTGEAGEKLQLSVRPDSVLRVTRGEDTLYEGSDMSLAVGLFNELSAKEGV